jgi:hypothetical protein
VGFTEVGDSEKGSEGIAAHGVRLSHHHEAYPDYLSSGSGVPLGQSLM